MEEVGKVEIVRREGEVGKVEVAHKKMSNQDNLWKVRHSCEHVLQEAILQIFGEDKIKLAMGPATDEGFYCDFEILDENLKITENDFEKIEKVMQKIIDKNSEITKKIVSYDEAKKLFGGNSYKMEWVEKSKDEEISLYYTGKDYFDLCKGPHTEKTGNIKAFKLLSIAGAYWHGDEKNKMLTRIYGTAFETKEELEKYLFLIEESKKRDHRKLGKDLDLFHFDPEIGAGLPIWLPNGNIIKEELEKWAKETEKKWGYKRVTTPIITKETLFYTSGHLPMYKESMYAPIEIEKENYYIKPMNCPFHHKTFASRPRSYKELPLRIAEYGVCHRYEDSGSLFGLMRVRAMCMNDSHIYCSENQAIDEFLNVIKLHEYYYKILGITDYEMELALRDPKNMNKYHGDESDWKKAEEMTIEAMKRSGVAYKIVNEGAAFYGPKMDFQIKSSIGRTFTASTNQLDLYMGKKFNLEFVNQNGEKETPVVIHRAPLGTHERFIGFLIEHFAGAFPLWLSPVQIKILPISDKFNNYAKEVENILVELGENNGLDIRVEIDDRSERVQAKIRDAEMMKIPYLLVVGGKEEESKSVSLRVRGKGDLGSVSLESFGKDVIEKIKGKSLEL